MNQPTPAIQATSGKPPVVAGETDQQQYLTFSLGEEMFAIGILAIREIIEYGNITEVPMVPPFIRGVINLRGGVVPVIDLAVRFGRQATENTCRTCIVIIELADAARKQQMGIVVDSVSEVLEIWSADIEPRPQFGTHVRTDFIAGMAKIDGRLVILLEVARILSLDEASAIAGVQPASD